MNRSPVTRILRELRAEQGSLVANKSSSHSPRTRCVKTHFDGHAGKENSPLSRLVEPEVFGAIKSEWKLDMVIYQNSQQVFEKTYKQEETATTGLIKHLNDMEGGTAQERKRYFQKMESLDLEAQMSPEACQLSEVEKQEIDQRPIKIKTDTHSV